MSRSAISTAPPGSNTPAWRTYSAKRIAVHAPDGSYAARRAATELREAERAVAALERLLEPGEDRSGARVDIYLADPVAMPAGDSPVTGAPEDGAGIGLLEGGEAIVRTVQPEAPGEPLVYPLARLLVARWFGQA